MRMKKREQDEKEEERGNALPHFDVGCVCCLSLTHNENRGSEKGVI